MDNVNFKLCESLIQWLQILNLAGPHKNATELSDGVAMAQALNQIAPETFSGEPQTSTCYMLTFWNILRSFYLPLESWLVKIKPDCGHNWRLKMSNLKKVIEGVFDYYTDVLNLSLHDFEKPDVQKIAEKGDAGELGRLLQLILGCAVNCSSKQDYITQIMDVEESLQRNIMRALQDLECVWQGAASSRGGALSLSFDTKALQDERDTLAQKCHETERRVRKAFPHTSLCYFQPISIFI